MRHAYTLSGLALIASLMMLGCGGPSEYALVGTARAAGTDGTVTVEEIEGGNNLVTIQLEHLPPPERLGENLKVYVLWISSPNAPAQLESKLEYDPDTREGTAMATTPFNKFTVRITAEKSVQVSTPSEVVVAKRQIGK